MSFIQDPLYLLSVLLILVVLSEWLAKKRFFSHIGASLIIIIAAAILANAGIIPTSTNAPPLYSGIFTYIAPLAIFFLLLDVRLRDLKVAGLPMLMLFLIGSLSTVIGTFAGYFLLSPGNYYNKANALAGMYAGTDIGGSVNFNAVALQYGVTSDASIYAAANAADNIVGTTWIIVTLLLPPVLYKLKPVARTAASKTSTPSTQLKKQVEFQKEEINVIGIATLLFLGLITLFISKLFSTLFPAIPSILVLTTIALGIAQIPYVQRIKGGKVFGFFLVLVFLAVIGAYCDIPALISNGRIAVLVLSWDGIIVFVHGLLIFTIGMLLKKDWDIIAIASNANIGGTVTAPVCATSLGRKDLQLPGLLAGSVGNAIGTYIGVFIAEVLKH